jgi:hypothetical protein
MSRHLVLKAALAAAFPAAIIVLPAWSPAVAPSRIAGTFTVKYAEQHPIPVPDAAGHALMLGRVEGVNRSTGQTPYMDQGKVTSLEFGDLTQGNGPHQGYITFSSGPDSVISTWNGKVTTTLSPDKTPMTSFAGTWTKLRGTGRYQEITGQGTYKGRFISQSEYTVNWQGEISGERLAQK